MEQRAGRRKPALRIVAVVVTVIAVAYVANYIYLRYKITDYMGHWDRYANVRARVIQEKDGKPDFVVSSQSELKKWTRRFRPYGSVELPPEGRVVMYCVIFRGSEGVVYLSVDKDGLIQSAALGL